MKMKIKLDETEITQAIREYVEKQGYHASHVRLESNPAWEDGPHYQPPYVEAEVEVTVPQPKPTEEKGKSRTRSKILKLRAETKDGCCQRWKDHITCDCLEEAIDDLPYRLPKRKGPSPGEDTSHMSLEEYDRKFDNGCSICRDPNCSDPGGKH